MLRPPLSEVLNDRTDASTREPARDSRVPFHTSVLLNSEAEFVLGASVWVGDGELFVAADQRLDPETDVEVSFVLPERDETVQMTGTVRSCHDGADDVGQGRSGMRIAIDPGG